MPTSTVSEATMCTDKDIPMNTGATMNKGTDMVTNQETHIDTDKDI